MNEEQMKELAVTLRWLQREAALAWREGDGASEDRFVSKGEAIAYGKLATYLERFVPEAGL